MRRPFEIQPDELRLILQPQAIATRGSEPSSRSPRPQDGKCTCHGSSGRRPSELTAGDPPTSEATKESCWCFECLQQGCGFYRAPSCGDGLANWCGPWIAGRCAAGRHPGPTEGGGLGCVADNPGTGTTFGAATGVPW